ncbi:hypothetical protein [Paraburkholderia largidicola]|jgi:hypothetical protein|uniref:Uncharacterized protein n=1 Tax=Paraburkholderia largidicola TaxID=3014751 RepID=A0A7I8C085_9BURK|nr:hypothetical protein [Paraburkholderia sp. PGU16]BCF93921.1 hypothetical protein PPGU16_69880 [Paraburkholderia sp. PGU16]
MKIQFIDNGNLSSWLRLALIVVGLVFGTVAIEYDLPNVWARVLLLGGFFLVLIGGMASRAKLLNIKPFDNSYKKARKTYESNDNEERK